ncbi:putative pre-RNA processing PIH1/Nop17 [Blattamonas nauphoetae]|uniref:Pre-RNA processing PIH1/Nop17 n=1 Tax=Blattamonas nauphoetae TaxID=2049346 RepID=A0ABQ9YLX7_9EUKA|nr:putative pre-RNA processing PIH1/Nop17 [Blattamonas nauphoetae]
MTDPILPPRSKNEKVVLTEQEKTRFEECFKDPTFAKMFADYMQEISDPKNLEEYTRMLEETERLNQPETPNNINTVQQKVHVPPKPVEPPPLSKSQKKRLKKAIAKQQQTTPIPTTTAQPKVSIQQPTIPKHRIIESSNFQLQDYTMGNDVNPVRRPESIRVVFELPLCGSAIGIDADIGERHLTLKYPEDSDTLIYATEVKLPYPIIVDGCKAQFDKTTRELSVTCPVQAPPKQHIPNSLNFTPKEAATEVITMDDMEKQRQEYNKRVRQENEEREAENQKIREEEERTQRAMEAAEKKQREELEIQRRLDDERIRLEKIRLEKEEKARQLEEEARKNRQVEKFIQAEEDKLREQQAEQSSERQLTQPTLFSQGLKNTELFQLDDL